MDWSMEIEKVAVLPVPDWACHEQRSAAVLTSSQSRTHLGNDIATLDHGRNGTLLNGGRLLETCRCRRGSVCSSTLGFTFELTICVDAAQQVLLQTERVERRRLHEDRGSRMFRRERCKDQTYDRYRLGRLKDELCIPGCVNLRALRGLSPRSCGRLMRCRVRREPREAPRPRLIRSLSHFEPSLRAQEAPPRRVEVSGKLVMGRAGGWTPPIRPAQEAYRHGCVCMLHW